VFTPGTPTPGIFCTGAPLLTAGVLYNFTTNTGPGSQQWVMWNVAPGPCTFNANPVAGATFFPTAFTGSSCAALTGPLLLPFTPIGFVTDGTGNVWLQVVNTTGGANAWSVQLN